MAYKIGQYHYNSKSGIELDYMTPVQSTVTAERFKYRQDIQVEEINLYKTLTLDNEGLKSETPFNSDTLYYFKGEIQKKSYEQVFYVKLVSRTSDIYSEKGAEQFLKRIVIPIGDVTEWVPVEFTFSPVGLDQTVSFNTILFELQVDYSDFVAGVPKTAHIIYLQLSTVNNIIKKVQNNMIGSNDDQITPFIKLGIQSHPGLPLCINEEEMKLSRTGMLEFRDGMIPIYFFSLLMGGQESASTLQEVEAYKAELAEYFTDIDQSLNFNQQEQERRKRYAEKYSCSFVDRPVSYASADSFTLDYGYEE